VAGELLPGLPGLSRWTPVEGATSYEVWFTRIGPGAGWTKKVTGLPTITVGSVGLDGEFIAAFGGAGSKPASLDGLIARLEKDEFDLVAVGRALLADPHWVEKIRDGRLDELKDFERSAMATLS